MLTLTEFLLARVAEDEATAREVTVTATRHRRWAADGGEITVGVEVVTPARVLAECEAKRRIIELHEDTASNAAFSTVNEDVSWWTLCALALPYADHPDYHEEWKP